MKNIMLGGFHGNPNIGLYGFATDEFCILGQEIPTHIAEQIGKTLDVPIVRTNIAGTGLVGVFVAGNKHGIIIPSLAFDTEMRTLERHKIPFTVIDTSLTALGNNIVVNDSKGFINPMYDAKEIAQIEKALKVKLVAREIAGMPMVGGLAAINKFGGLVHSEASVEDIKAVSELTDGEVLSSTLNFGNPYIRSSILVNNNGIVIGSKSTGVEVADAEQAFGLT